MGAGQATPDYDMVLAEDKNMQCIIMDADKYDNPGAAPRRAKGCETKLDDAQTTIWRSFKESTDKNADSPLYGTRVHEQNGATRGKYIWETYGEIRKQVDEFGSGLADLGLGVGENVGIYAPNRTEWMVSSLSNFRQGIRTVALYDTLGTEAVSHILEHAELPAVMCSKDKVKKIFEAKKFKSTIPLKYIVQFDVNEKYQNQEEDVSVDDQKAAEDLGLELLSLSDVRKKGAAAIVPPAEMAPNDLAFIMYTSGTTGIPKGAMLSHNGVMSCVEACQKLAGLTSTDTHISFLPLAHIFDTVVQSGIIKAGGSVGFFGGNIKTLVDDIGTLRPTFFAAVPRVYNKIYSKIMAQVESSMFIKRWMFNYGLGSSTDLIRHGGYGERSPFWDGKIWEKTRAKVGLDRVRLMATGAAPTPPYLFEFFNVLVGAPMVQAYGMTEQSGACCASLPTDRTIGHNGPPLSCCEIRLEDIPEMEYLTSDSPPRGEILVRGPIIFEGYYKNEEATKECLDQDGWIHSGDVGRWNNNGTLSIIDRKKNIFKLSQGEYVAAEKLESVYAKADSVNQIYIYGNSYKSFVVGVVVPDAAWVVQILKDKSAWTGGDALIATPPYVEAFKESVEKNVDHVKKLVRENMKKFEDELKGFEKVRDILIEYDLDDLLQGFNVDNECLTPSFKLRRPFLMKRYMDKLKEMYTNCGEAPKSDEKWGRQ